MNLFIFSNSIKTLEYDHMKTSSEKFEYELAHNLINYGDISLTIYSSAVNNGEEKVSSKIKLVGLKDKSKLDVYKNFKNIINKGKKPDIIMFYGYDLFKVISMILIKKKYRIKTVAFIFDSHLGAIKRYNLIKRNIAKIYFNISIKLLNILDGFILFQDQAARELNLLKPYHVSKPGINKDNYKYLLYLKDTNKFTITYMGSLMEYNGIRAMIDTFKLNKNNDIRIRIFGTGELEKEIIEFSRRDNRVYYGGLVDQKTINKELENTDLLLNLRDPEDYVCKFAYPSKLIEYMATGIPILSTDLNFEDDMKECLYIVNSLNSSEINNKIHFIMNESAENINIKTKKAKKHLKDNNDWELISKDIISYLDII